MKLPARASAPGKLMISGEYAVLDGAVAVVASVSARVYAHLSASPSSRDSSQHPRLPAEAVLARRLAEELYGPVEAELSIEAGELRESGRKLGLGSSAAASTAAVGAVLHYHGQDLSEVAAQRCVLELALRGHKAVAPDGSGADVAAASLGGFVSFRLEQGTLAQAEPLNFPDQVRTRVVWTGKEARTSEFVRAVRGLKERDASGYGRIRDRLKSKAARFAEAIMRADAAEILAAAAAYGRVMGELGEQAGVPIVTRELAKVAAIAHEHGGAAKPSGAGGGDVAVAFFARESDAQAFDAACDQHTRLQRLDLALGAPGVRMELVG